VTRTGLALLLLGTLVAGCAGQEPLYAWGRYETILWEGYQAEGDPTTHVILLEEDVKRAVAEGKRVPPGVHAQIGFLYYSTGDLADAREHFLTERELFPESAVFIDGVLARMERQTAEPEPSEIAEPSVPAEDAGEAPNDEREVSP